jgi:predicted aldo/keto reductase-like oxidoreductase
MNREPYSKTRREFLRSGLTGLAGISLLPAYAITEHVPLSERPGLRKPPFIHRILGRTGLKPAVIGIGATGMEITRAALDAGLNYLDSANFYGYGRHEMGLGFTLKGRPRDSFIITTKILGLRDNRTGMPPANITPSEFKADFKKRLNDGLKRLQLDHLDVLFLHGVDNPDLVGLPLVRDVMLESKEEGKARFLGVSFHHKEPEFISSAVKEKIYDVILTAYNFRQPHREEVTRAIASAAGEGIGIVAMKVMAGAFWDKERKHPINGAAALKWTLRNEHVHATIPSFDSFEQMNNGLGVMADLELTPDDEKDLKEGDRLGLAGLYCAQCGQCREQCRYHLDVPTAMRSYMYAYGYRNPRQAKTTLQAEQRGDLVCRRCPSCQVACPMGFDVSARMRDIARILEMPDDFLA